MITAPFDLPFYTGGGVTGLVPDVYPIAINGRPYMIDTAPEFAFMRDRWQHESLPLLRAQADNAQTPAETSLNPDALWRRAQDSWHHGAGQTYRDRTGDANLDDPFRFRSSKGLNVWTHYQLGLLPTTDQKKSSANTNVRGVTAGARYYVADGSALTYTTSITPDTPTFTATTGYTGGSIVALCSDGFTVYFTDGADLWTTNTGTNACSSVNTLNLGGIAYVKGRVMAFGTGGTKNVLYNLTDITDTTPDYTVTHANADFTWVGFADGLGAIYAAGYSGDKSLIYRISIKADATALDQPIVAGELPDGEIIRAISGYLGTIWVGTDKGWRFCPPKDAQGNLDIGVLVQQSSAVQAFEPQDRFMWFGWTNYDGSSTGLGRADLTESTGIPGSNQVAYASDLMVTGSGAVLSIATFQSIRVFTISGLGVYAEDTPLVASGTIDGGLIGYGLPDNKTAIFVDVRTSAVTGGSYTVWVASDDGAFTQYGGTQSTVGGTGAIIPLQRTAERFEVRLVFARDSGTTTLGPTVLRWTLKAFPAPQDGQVQTLVVPVLLHRDLSTHGIPDPIDVRAEHDILSDLRATHEVITLQEIDRTYTGTIAETRWVPDGLSNDITGGYRFPDGTMVVTFKQLF